MADSAGRSSAVLLMLVWALSAGVASAKDDSTPATAKIERPDPQAVEKAYAELEAAARTSPRDSFDVQAGGETRRRAPAQRFRWVGEPTRRGPHPGGVRGP